MKVVLNKKSDAEAGQPSGLVTERASAVNDPWAYAYLLTGRKKVGKTSFAVEGVEEFVYQFDKPQIARNIRERCFETWRESAQYTKLIEQAAAAHVAGRAEFPYQRIVVDGAGEWYQKCQANTCKLFQIEHPSDAGYAKAWHHLRDTFTDEVNRLLRLQTKVGCGLIFIAHSETKEKKLSSGMTVEVDALALPPRAEEILNGKCDAWFTMDWRGDKRVMVTQGDEMIGAGHRIIGHFLTTDGRPVCEVDMGDSPAEARVNFEMAFHNQQKHASVAEARDTGASRQAVAKKVGAQAKRRLVVNRAK